MTKLSGYTNYWTISGWIGLIIFFFIFWPDTASAQTAFKSIVDIPGITGEPSSTENFGIYINALYIFAITVGAMLAVLKLVAAGVKYMFSDIVTNKEDAKNDIKGAILGLLIVIGAVVILNTINTDLTNVDLDLESVETDTTDYLGEAINQLRSRILACTEEVGCRTYSGVSEGTCREMCGGRDDCFINGNLFNGLSGWGGGYTFNRCLVQHEGAEAEKIICEAGGREWDNQNQVCIESGQRNEEISCGGLVAQPICSSEGDPHALCTNEDRGVRINVFDCTDAIEQCTSGGGTTNTAPGQIRNASVISCIYNN